MGRNSRPAPSQLAKKLKAVRLHLGMSQAQMFALVKPGEDAENRSMISQYESGRIAPDYQALLRYARLAKVSADLLIDDRLELGLEGNQKPTDNAASAAVIKDEKSSQPKIPPTSNTRDRETDPGGAAVTAPVTASTAETPTERRMEDFTVPVDSRFLDLLDDAYLDLLRLVPRSLRPLMKRDDFFRAVIIAPLGDYLDNGEESCLVYQWRQLEQRTAGRGALKTAAAEK